LNEKIHADAILSTEFGAKEDNMQAKDIMTADLIAVSTEAEVTEIAKLLLRHRISAVPVVDARQRLVGMVSEGDLIHRAETGTDRQRSWWLSLLTDAEDIAQAYRKSHGRHARDVMSGDIVTVTEDTPLADIARLLEERRVKRVPVVRDGALLGIVSRADLLRAMASGRATSATAVAGDDQKIRQALLRTLKMEALTTGGLVNVIVTDGVVHLWGLVESEDMRKAIIVAAETTPGVLGVNDHLGQVPPWAWAG
jgi:CBS-domain-containing membrane protein